MNEGTELLPRWFFIDSFLIIEMTKTMPVLGQLSFEDKVYKWNKLISVLHMYILGGEKFLLMAKLDYRVKSVGFLVFTISFARTGPTIIYILNIKLTH